MLSCFVGIKPLTELCHIGNVSSKMDGGKWAIEEGSKFNSRRGFIALALNLYPFSFILAIVFLKCRRVPKLSFDRKH